MICAMWVLDFLHQSKLVVVSTQLLYSGQALSPVLELNFWSLGSMVRIVSVPLAGWYGVQILVGSRDFSLLQNNQTHSEAHAALC